MSCGGNLETIVIFFSLIWFVGRRRQRKNGHLGVGSRTELPNLSDHDAVQRYTFISHLSKWMFVLESFYRTVRLCWYCKSLSGVFRCCSKIFRFLYNNCKKWKILWKLLSIYIISVKLRMNVVYVKNFLQNYFWFYQKSIENVYLRWPSPFLLTVHA